MKEMVHLSELLEKSLQLYKTTQKNSFGLYY